MLEPLLPTCRKAEASSMSSKDRWLPYGKAIQDRDFQRDLFDRWKRRKGNGVLKHDFLLGYASTRHDSSVPITTLAQPVTAPARNVAAMPSVSST